MSIFDTVKMNRPKKSKFDLSYENKFTANFGDLIPFFKLDVLPGDVISTNSEVFSRTMALLAPTLSHVNLYTHYFFVPYRLLWNNWEKFITGGPQGTETPVMPWFAVKSTDSSMASLHCLNNWKIVSSKIYQEYSLSSFFNSGLNDTSAATLAALKTLPVLRRVNPFPFLAYNLIYNEYYRDQTFSEKRPCYIRDTNVSQGIDETASMFLVDGTSGLIYNTIVGKSIVSEFDTIQLRCWKKDYFTSALPWAQRGPEALIPVVGNAPVTGEFLVNKSAGTGSIEITASSDTNSNAITRDLLLINSVQSDYPNRGLQANLENISTNINDLRKSFSLQRWLENNARGGARYIEQILAHFGVVSPDYRLNRPQFLGGGKSQLNISDVMQQAQSTTTPLGTIAGKGVSYGNANGFRQKFTEHGIILGILSIQPTAEYFQGKEKYMSKFDRYDYAFPEFAHLGEQPIMNSELFYIQGGNDGIFGYTPRYAEYKFNMNQLHGDLASNLNFWTMSRSFSAVPTLGDSFLKVNPANLNTAFAVTDSRKFVVDIFNRCYAVRPLPKYGTPSII